jgi:hypothetical protein
MRDLNYYRNPQQPESNVAIHEQEEEHTSMLRPNISGDSLALNEIQHRPQYRRYLILFAILFLGLVLVLISANSLNSPISSVFIGGNNSETSANIDDVDNDDVPNIPLPEGDDGGGTDENDDSGDQDDPDEKDAPEMTEAEVKKMLSINTDKREADVLTQLLKKLGNGPYFPVIIGGIGDSGTRGVREILRNFRVQMLADSYVNPQGDSQLFEKSYPVYDPKSKTWSERTARMLYKQGIHRARTLKYNASNFNEKTWEYGRQFVGAMLWRTMNVSAMFRSKKNVPLRFWGMKHPRSLMILPFLAAAMGDKMRFVHVLRDPKEVVSGDNQQMFVGECRRYYGRMKCSRSFEKKYEFWTDMDSDALQIAKQFMTKQNYLMVRIEDFVLGDRKCFERLARFIGIPEADMKQDMERAMLSTTSHLSTYLGHHLNEATKSQLYAALKMAPARVPAFMNLVGYSTNSFPLTKSCLELPGPDN